MADLTGDTPEQLAARQKVQALLRDMQFRKAYYHSDPTSPAHKAAVAKLQSLMDAGDPKPGIDNTRAH